MAVTKFAQHGLVRLGYEVTGEREPKVLVLHGLLQGRATMRPLTDELEERATVITMDIRSHGGSSAVQGLDLRLADLVDDAMAVLDAAEVASDAIVIGVELGAVIAAEMHAAYPERVRGTVLINFPSDEMLDAETLNAIATLAYREQAEQALNRWLDMSWGEGWKELIPKARIAAARRSAGAIHPILAALAQADIPMRESISLPGGAPFAEEADVATVVAALESQRSPQ